MTPVAWETDPGETPGLHTESRSFEKLSQCAGKFEAGPAGQGAFPHFSLGGSYRLLSQEKPTSLPDLAWLVSSQSCRKEMLSEGEGAVERKVMRMIRAFHDWLTSEQQADC